MLMCSMTVSKLQFYASHILSNKNSNNSLGCCLYEFLGFDFHFHTRYCEVLARLIRENKDRFYWRKLPFLILYIHYSKIKCSFETFFY